METEMGETFHQGDMRYTLLSLLDHLSEMDLSANNYPMRNYWTLNYTFIEWCVHYENGRLLSEFLDEHTVRAWDYRIIKKHNNKGDK